MSGDPAVEAARQAIGRFPDGTNLYPRSVAVSAAREALKPVRELHSAVDTYLYATSHCDLEHEVTDSDSGDVCLTCTAADGGPVKTCSECFEEDGSKIDWPCSTARLVYSEAEL